MKKSLFILSLLMLVPLSVSCGNKKKDNSIISTNDYYQSIGSVEQNTPTSGNVKINILELNDVHGYGYESSYNSNYNFASVAYYYDKIQKQQDYDNVLMIANGDMFQGTAFSNLSHGKSMISAMNEMHFDMMGIGNHEFDWGLDEVLKYWDGDESNGEASFPLINGNIVDTSKNNILVGTDSDENKIGAYTIVDKGGIKIGLLSYLGNQTSSISQNKLGNYKIACSSDRDIYFLERVKEQALACKEHGADIIVLNFHEGNSDGINELYYNRAFAEMKDSNDKYLIDAVINGHTHTKQSGKISRTNGEAMPVVQSNGNCNSIGMINLTVDASTKRVKETTCSSNYINELVGLTDKNEMVQAILDSEFLKISNQISEVLSKNMSSSSRENIGYWTTNIMKKYANADVAFINTGGIRNTLPSGNITIKELYDVNPFDNSIVYVEATGTELKNYYTNSGSYCYFDDSFNVGEIMNSKTYKIVTIDYVYYGNYFQKYFSKAKTIKIANDLCARDLMALDLKSKTGGFNLSSSREASLETKGWPLK